MAKGDIFSVILSILLFAQQFHALALSSQIDIQPGPKSGVLIKEAPGLLLTERKMVSQTIFVDLDPARTIMKRIPIPSPEDKDALAWYNAHLNRTRESVQRMLEQLEKTFVSKEPNVPGRQKRFVGMLIGAIVLLVLGVVVGTSMSIANSVSVAQVNEKSENLQASLNLIQHRIRIQEDLTEQLIQMVNETIVIQDQHARLISKSIDLHQKHKTAWWFIHKVQEPMNYLTQEYLRELQFNIASLIKGSIPLYFVSMEDVKNILGQLHHVIIDDMQLRVALEMGSAVPLYVHPKEMQISYMLNLPLVLPEKIYQTKQVLNVGVWKADRYLKVKTPDLIAYQPWSDGTHLVPNLDTCSVFKDLNYLCPGKPFIPEFTNTGCGITHYEDSLNVCEVTISNPDIFVFNTVAILVDKRWLVSTALSNMTVTYANHGTFKVLPLEYSVFLITVPKDMIVTIGNFALFYISGEERVEELELINVFDHEKVPIDPDLEYLLQSKPNHTLRFSIKRTNLTVEKYMYSSGDLEVIRGRDWLQLKVYLLWVCVGFILVWMGIITLLMYKVYRAYRRYNLMGGPMGSLMDLSGVTTIKIDSTDV